MAQLSGVETWQGELDDMPPDEFRAYGRRVVDWIADYLENVERYPVLSQAAPGAIRAALPASPPDAPEDLGAVLRDVDDLILSGITHWNHPAFFAYFAISGSAPGILAEFLTAALNVNGMLWRTSPAATELEETTLGWLRQLIGLPGGFDGVIYDTASIASLVAIAAAREAIGADIRGRGMAGRGDLPALRLYCSKHAHSSIEKAAITLGIGQESVRKIATDDRFRLDPAALRRAIEEDRATGLLPFCVVATVGTTSTTSVDPVPVIADICREYALWLHVDGAYGGIAAILPEMRWVLDGVERADSLVVNPHKWLFTPLDLSAFYTRRLADVREAFALVPEYLRSSSAEPVRDYMDYGPQLGRRFRALKLWFVLRTYGREGLSVRLHEHLRLAQEFARWVDEDPDWERLAPVPFSTVCFRYRPASLDDASVDRLNEAIMNHVNAGGRIFLSHTRLRDRFTLRLAVGNIRTQERHVRLAWDVLREAAAAEAALPR